MISNTLVGDFDLS